MKFANFQLGTRLIVVSPVPSSRLTVFQIMIENITNIWEGLQCDTQLLMQDNAGLLQQIANLLPRHDVPATAKTTGWDVGEMGVKQIQDFFFYRQDDSGNVIPSHIVELHQSTIESSAEQQLEPIEGEDIGDWMPPVPSCGDPELDLAGQLLSVFGVDGIGLLDCFDQNSLNLLIQVYNNNQQDPESRRREYMTNLYSDYKNQNSDTMKNALGLDDFDIRTIGKQS